MRSSFFGLDSAKRAIQISQKALDITSNNLSNAKTDGYTRQRVDTASLSVGTYNNWTTKNARLSQNGAGVTAFGVSQVRDPYIDKRYRETTCSVDEYSTKSDILSEIETALDNFENKGLSSAYTTLQQAISTYATNAADNDEMASIVRNQSYNITTMLNSFSTQLQNIKDTNLYSLETSIEGVNQLVAKIVSYNDAIVDEYSITGAEKIYNGESVNNEYGPNELIDARNMLIDELSYYGNIEVEENLNGSVKIKFGDTVVVDDQKYETLSMRNYDEYGAAVLRFSNGDDINVSAGTIKAYTDILNGNGPYASYYQNSDYGIPYYQSAIDAFASSFSGLMNQLNGCTETDTTRAMFGSTQDVYNDDGECTYRATITAGNIRISDEWMADATMIGQVYNENSDAWEYPDLDGNNANALLDGLENTNVAIGNAGDFNGTIFDYIAYVSNRLGQNIEYYNNAYDVAKETADGLLTSREGVSGVSDTEEGINMMVYQNWYNASSRMMTTMDDCLDKLINGTGRVGL